MDKRPERRIEFKETLGKGGFGAVYLAHVHGRDNFVQRLAVKVLSAEMSETADIAARQRDEARLLAQLDHDNIVRVVDLTEVHGRPAVLMEYVEGIDAGALLRVGPLPPRTVLEITAATGSALHAAFTSPSPLTGRPLQVIHRDIKPANLVVSRHGTVKVLDFGVARANFDREGQTCSVQFGTARFMAPEQWLYGEASHAVDVYALGVSTVEMLAGGHLSRAPLDPEAYDRHVQAVLAAVTRPEWPPGWATELQALLAAMLAFQPLDRPTAGELHERAGLLAEDAPGEGLRRYAARAVPPLIEERRARFKDTPVLDEVAVPMDATPKPDRTAPVARPDTTAPVARLDPTVRIAPDSSESFVVDTARTPDEPPPRWIAVIAGAVGLAAVLAVSVVTVAVLWAGGVFEGGTPPTAVPEPAPAEPVVIDAEPAADTTGEPPGKAVPAEQAETPIQPPPRTSPRSSPAPAPEREPQRPRIEPPAVERAAVETAAAEPPPPEPAAPEAADVEPALPAPAALPTHTVKLVSRPWGARVLVDGKPVAAPAPTEVVLTEGSHVVRMEHGEASIERMVQVTRRQTHHWIWDVETGEWQQKQ